MSNDYHSDFQSGKSHGLSDVHAGMLALGKHQARMNAASSPTHGGQTNYGSDGRGISWNFFWGLLAVLCLLGLIISVGMYRDGLHGEIWSFPAFIAGAAMAVFFVWKQHVVKPVFYKCIKLAVLFGVMYVVASALIQTS